MKRFLNQLIPFFLLGVTLVALTFGIILLAYLFVFGAILGCILYCISWIRRKFFPPTTITTTQNNQSNKPGRIIDSDDWKEL